jgi:hypothetical protein
VLAYQQACTEAVERCGGYVAQYLGDGVLAYFGYPQAHEDDAVRAVRAALALIDRMPVINQRLLAEHGVGLEVRAGLHTGLVVAGEVGAGQAREQLAIGETPNIAARVQAVAGAGCVVVSEGTWRLVEGFFTAEPLGPQALKGVSRPMPVYRIVAATGVINPFEARVARRLTPLVGREVELALLQKRWEQATEGEGQAVCLQGDAGLGKSRLVRAFREWLGSAEHQAITLNCSSQHQASTFYPVVDEFTRGLQFEPEDNDLARQGRLSAFIGRLGLPASRLLPALAALLGVATDDSVPNPPVDPAQRRRETLAARHEDQASSCYRLGVGPRQLGAVTTRTGELLD